MKNPRHQFILLGFLAQVLVWDSYVALGLVAALWVICLLIPRDRIRIPLGAEALALLVGCAASFFTSYKAGTSTHFFLGDGLILLQAVRLIRPLNHREKLTSILIAFFHFGVLCTLAQNIRFAFLFAGAILLLPKALEDLQLDDFGEHARFHPRFGFIRYLFLLLISIVIFLFLPRFFNGAPLFQGLTEQGSLLDSVLDPRRRGSANSQRVLLQIHGELIGYLKCYVLQDFDGIRWNQDRNPVLRSIKSLPKRSLHRENFREVQLKNSAFLGHILPVDGTINRLEGNFFQRPEDKESTIECGSMWNMANNIYNYWIDPHPEPEELSPARRRHLTYHPEQSRRLTAWLAQVTVDSTNQIGTARKIEAFLRNNYTYTLGAPELDRLNPIEDFIFNQKEGHCERFAAALALFFRMEGIPSRVVIGYVSSTRNPFTGWQQVRFKDAHSWTEGYIDGLGWIRFDSTPGPRAGEKEWNISRLLDAIDFAWYSNVVNFDGISQRQMLTESGRAIASIPAWIEKRWLGLALVLLLILVALVAWNAPWKSLRLGVRRRVAPEVIVRNSYTNMLRLAQSAGFERGNQDTPYEFLETLRRGKFPGMEEAELLTATFCESNYGRRTLSSETNEELAGALGRLKEKLKLTPS